MELEGEAAAGVLLVLDDIGVEVVHVLAAAAALVDDARLLEVREVVAEGFLVDFLGPRAGGIDPLDQLELTDHGLLLTS